MQPGPPRKRGHWPEPESVGTASASPGRPPGALATTAAEPTAPYREEQTWAVLTFCSYGVNVGVRVNDRRLLDRVAERLPFGAQLISARRVDREYSLVLVEADAEGTAPHVSLHDGAGTQYLVEDSLDQALTRLESDLQLCVAELASDRVFIHAGVVGWRGWAIVIPGRSHTGKTTLVAELVRAGATYYSDEYAVLDEIGYVHPFARPLSLRKGDGSAPIRESIEELGGKAGAEALPVGLVVVSRYRPGARWRPRLLTPGQGVLELLDNTIGTQRRPQEVLATLHRVVGLAEVIKGTRSEARRVARSLLSHLETCTTSNDRAMLMMASEERRNRRRRAPGG